MVYNKSHEWKNASTLWGYKEGSKYRTHENYQYEQKLRIQWDSSNIITKLPTYYTTLATTKKKVPTLKIWCIITLNDICYKRVKAKNSQYLIKWISSAWASQRDLFGWNS